jgi:hypothetical protein
MEVEILKRKANMDESRICWICRGEFLNPFPDDGDNIVVDCCNCGDYKISKSLRASRFPLADSERYRFSFWGKQRQLEKRGVFLLNSYTIDDIVAGLPRPPVHDKPDILLRSFSLLHPEPGKTFKIDGYRQYSLAAASDDRELSFHIRTLVERDDLKQRPGPDFQITGKGWTRIGRMSASTAGNTMPVADELATGNNIISHGQSGGITGQTVNVMLPASTKSERWWERWGAIAVGVATIAATVIGGLTYCDSHQTGRPVDHSSVAPLQQMDRPSPKAPSPTVCQDTTNSNCAQNNYGQQVVIGYVAPPYRVISPDKMTAAIATLQLAPKRAKVRINYAAVDGDKEIEPFFKQVTALFAGANHWHIETARIGKSMSFADGGTLTGEGIGCTAPPKGSGAIAEKAMDTAGFPCARKAADWGSSGLKRADIVISIGSRIVPPQ